MFKKIKKLLVFSIPIFAPACSSNDSSQEDFARSEQSLVGTFTVENTAGGTTDPVGKVSGGALTCNGVAYNGVLNTKTKILTLASCVQAQCNTNTTAISFKRPSDASAMTSTRVDCNPTWVSGQQDKNFAIITLSGNLTVINPDFLLDNQQRMYFGAAPGYIQDQLYMFPTPNNTISKSIIGHDATFVNRQFGAANPSHSLYCSGGGAIPCATELLWNGGVQNLSYANPLASDYGAPLYNYITDFTALNGDGDVNGKKTGWAIVALYATTISGRFTYAPLGRDRATTEWIADNFGFGLAYPTTGLINGGLSAKTNLTIGVGSIINTVEPSPNDAYTISGGTQVTLNDLSEMYGRGKILSMDYVRTMDNFIHGSDVSIRSFDKVDLPVAPALSHVFAYDATYNFYKKRVDALSSSSWSGTTNVTVASGSTLVMTNASEYATVTVLNGGTLILSSTGAYRFKSLVVNSGGVINITASGGSNRTDILVRDSLNLSGNVNTSSQKNFGIVYKGTSTVSVKYFMGNLNCLYSDINVLSNGVLTGRAQAVNITLTAGADFNYKPYILATYW